MTEQDATRRKTVKLGRKFAGSIATRLDAHPQSADTERLEDENRILSLMKDVLSLEEPDAIAMNFITHAVEVHTSKYGFSKVIYDELFRLHQTRLKRPPKEDKPDESPMLRPMQRPLIRPAQRPADGPPPNSRPVPAPKPLIPPTPRAPANATPDSWKLRRALKA